MDLVQRFQMVLNYLFESSLFKRILAVCLRASLRVRFVKSEGILQFPA